jgi:hypothetical protein
MAGFLGKAPLTYDIGLVLEIAVLILLFVARYKFARSGKTMAHGYTIAIALVLHAISVLAVMIPSFARSLDILISDFFSPAIIATWIHIPIGFVVLILGAYLISEWRFQQPQAKCYMRVKLMRPLWLLWAFSVVLGILLYLSIAV